MGKGQIVSNIGEGQYWVKVLQDRSYADEYLAKIDSWIAAVDKKIAEVPSGDPEKKLPELKLTKASYEKQKEYYALIPPDRTLAMWCADYTTNLSVGAVVGIADINGDPDNGMNIRPGYVDSAAHLPDRDGLSMCILAMTPEQAFYNLAMNPGWKKWMPKYRYGTITEKYCSLCNVTLDTAADTFSGLGINQASSLSSVPIEYMDNDGTMFLVGDSVIVEFCGDDFAKPKVIGFKDHPRNTAMGVYIYSGITYLENYYLGVYDLDGNCVLVYDLNEALGAPGTTPISVIGSSEDTNMVYVLCSSTSILTVPMNWIYNGETARGVGLAPQYPDTRLGISPGGYLLFSWGATEGSYLNVTGCYMYGFPSGAAANTYNFLVVPFSGSEPSITPSDYEHYYTNMKAVGFVKNHCYISYAHGFDDLGSDGDGTWPFYPQNAENITDRFIGEFAFPPYSGSVDYYYTPSSASPNFKSSLLLSEKVGLATDDEYYMQQLIGHEGKLYIITTHYIEVREVPSGSVVFRKDNWTPYTLYLWGGYSNYEWGQFVKLNGVWLFACRFKEHDTEYSSPICFFSIDTFTLVGATMLPDVSHGYASKVAICNMPSSTIILDRINALRLETGLHPLAQSRNLTAVCQAHVAWCVSHNVLAHVGDGGKTPEERALAEGYFGVGEVLAMVTAEYRTYDEINSCIQAWRQEAGDLAILQWPAAVMVGYAAGTFQAGENAGKRIYVVMVCYG